MKFVLVREERQDNKSQVKTHTFGSNIDLLNNLTSHFVLTVVGLFDSSLTDWRRPVAELKA